jgi:hypothetical protein
MDAARGQVYDPADRSSAILQADFRDHRSRDDGQPGELAKRATGAASQVIAMPAADGRFAFAPQPAPTPKPDTYRVGSRGGGNDCWVVGFRFCSS